MLFCFFPYSVWLAWINFVILCTWNQQGNPDYRTQLKMMEHLCYMKKSFFNPCKVTNVFCLGFGCESPLIPSLPTSYPATSNYVFRNVRIEILTCAIWRRAFSILVKWQTCFVLALAVNHHSSLLCQLHIQHLATMSFEMWELKF